MPTLKSALGNVFLVVKFEGLEMKLFQYILDRNSKGLCVKDRYIIANAFRIRDQLLVSITTELELSDSAGGELKKIRDVLLSFKASYWFKQRHQLVSRRQTSTRKLPDNFDQIARNFVISCNNPRD